MAGTNQSTGDSRKLTPRPVGSEWGRRVGWLMCVGAAGLWLGVQALSLVGINRAEREWEASAASRLGVGARMREALLGLDGAVFRFQLGEDPEFQDQFAKCASRFAELMREAGAQAGSGDGAEEWAEVGRGYEAYLAGTRELLQRGVRGVRRETPAIVEAAVREISRPLHEAVDRWVQTQDAAWNREQSETRAQLRSVRRSMAVSAVLVLALIPAGWLAWGGARGARGDHEPLTRAALLRQERLAALGVLAAGVAHEIRNPLTALKFRLFSLKKALPPALVDHEDLVIVSREINRLERIVKDFLEFARPAEPKRTEVLAGPLLQEVHELFRADLERRGIHVRLDVDPATRVWADRQQLQQVLINLLQNAAESTPAGGAITLGARPGAATLFKRTQRMVMLEVADSGPGIAPEAEPKVFDPFFSTKDGGTGLGLSIAARIAELHDGYIQFASQPGRGTTFSVVLPQAKSHES